ncbi:unnamed protein product [Victoria cruziana]
MALPPGCEGKCCKLKKALYGLKQSPRAWFERLRCVLRMNGYRQGNEDHTLFVKRCDLSVAIFLVYVDDMIVTGDNINEINRLKKRLATEFELKDLGKLRYFLGIELARSKTGLILNQRKYTIDLQKETGKLGCRLVFTLIEANHKMSLKDGDRLDEEGKSRYQRLVGKLIYVTLTRPDITYAVNVVSQFMHAPTSVHLAAVDRILCYLKKNPGKGFLYTRGNKVSVEAYTDADWAGSVDDRRSTSGYCVYLGGNIIIWRNKKQSVCARSSTDAEYRAIAIGVIEILWVKILLRDIGIQVNNMMKFYYDNKAAISLSNNPVMYDRTKHVEIDRHFVREKIDSKGLILPYIKTKDQTADMFTKGLYSREFERNVCKLGMFDIYAQLEGEC